MDTQIFIDPKELHFLRKYNNFYEARGRKLNYKPMTATMSFRERNEIIQRNEKALIDESILQINGSRDYFLGDIDFKKMDSVIQYPQLMQRSIIVKATSACNMDCEYCYEQHRVRTVTPENTITLDTVKRIIELFGPNIGTWIWHGGEPTLLGVDFYRQANSLIKQMNPRTSITMQSNGMALLSHAWWEMFKEFNMSPGISFDGLKNDVTRKNTGHITRVFNVLENQQVRFSTICVLDKHNIHKMIDEYEYAKRLRTDSCMRLVSGSYIEDHGYYLDPEVVASNYIEFFNYWVRDQSNPVFVDFIDKYVKALLTGRGTCTNTDCVGEGWFSIFPNGDVYQCGRDWLQDYCFGNIFAAQSVQDFLTSPGFEKWSQGQHGLMKKCEACEFYYACHGGCPSNNLKFDPSWENPEATECYLTRKILSHIAGFLLDIKTDDYIHYNPLFINFLFKYGFRGPDMLEKINVRINEINHRSLEFSDQIVGYIK